MIRIGDERCTIARGLYPSQYVRKFWIYVQPRRSKLELFQKIEVIVFAGNCTSPPTETTKECNKTRILLSDNFV